MIAKLNGIEINGEIVPMSIMGKGPSGQGNMLVIYDDTTVVDGDVVQDMQGNEWWVIPNQNHGSSMRNVHQLTPK